MTRSAFCGQQRRFDYAQRRSDLVRKGRQHIRDGVLTVKQQKTGKPPELRAVLDATASEHLTFLVTATGGGNAFSEQFRNWRDAAALPMRCKRHGLHKAACTSARRSRVQRQRDHWRSAVTSR